MTGKPSSSAPKNTRRTLVLLCLTVFTSGILYHQIKNPPPPISQPTATEPAPTTQTPSPNFNYTPSDDDPQLSSTEAPHDALPGEAILTFDSAASFNRFLNQINHPGYEILAANQKLLSARLRITDPSQFANLHPDGSELDFNYALLTPLPVIPQQGVATEFANTALDFIRAPHDNKDAGKGVTIAILDTGIRNHRTLNGVAITQYDLSDSVASSDYASHGTAVASLIAGQTRNGIAPAATLIGIRVLDTDGVGDTYSLAEGIVQAVDAGANIINMSLGSYGTNQALANAIAYAESQGVVLVAAAGNDATTGLPYPAAYSSVLAVSAVDANGHPTDFANQSDSVSIAAPGVGVYAAWGDEDWISFTGTSASTPYVSGAIAALSSQLKIPAQEAATLLVANANDSGFPGADAQTGAGYIDLQRSIDSFTSYTDLAVSDIYLAPTLDENGQNTIYLTIQNRGTQNIPAASLDYTLPNGNTQSVYLGALTPGQVASHTLKVGTLELSATTGYSLTTEVKINDAIPENNTRQTTLTISPKPTP